MQLQAASSDRKALTPTLGSVMGGSASDYDLGFVESLVDAIASVAGGYIAGSVRLHGMTLLYADPAEAHDGYMEFLIAKDGLPPIAFGVEFGGKEHSSFPFDSLTLEALQEAAGLGDPVNGMATVLNFDELWLFANLLTKRLAFVEVSLAFGGMGGL
ncbi:hypothetical protein ACSFA0_22750 [Variovorax sp. LT1P1]|uniref:hypothetical protein n=1 Tax=Variovorax sp. LT1P1 TaxID=3443730 RepID=UPI003F47FCB8